MGFEYLNGKFWSQVTRDERFFCQRLFELIRSETAVSFVRYLCETHGLDVPVEGEWEVGFEVCFYRDLWQLREREGKLFSPKRTFDLCLFGENAIVIIEAKAAGGFDQDQNVSFELDIAEVKELTGVKIVQLVGLCSSKYNIEAELEQTFHGRILRWNDLATRYADDEVLHRADEVYEYQESFSNHGRHSDVKLSGRELRESYDGGASWWVGRLGGITGNRFSEDIRTGRWKTQMYEVSTKADGAPSSNYFSLGDFARAVGGLSPESDEPK